MFANEFKVIKFVLHKLIRRVDHLHAMNRRYSIINDEDDHVFWHCVSKWTKRYYGLIFNI